MKTAVSIEARTCLAVRAIHTIPTSVTVQTLREYIGIIYSTKSPVFHVIHCFDN